MIFFACLNSHVRRVLSGLLFFMVLTPGYTHPHYYGVASGGYGVFQDVLGNDGQSGILRLALGAQFNLSNYISLGGELGIQTGNRTRINTDTITPAVGDAPVFLTVKPPIDLLGTATYYFDQNPLFFQVKGGVVYIEGMVDSLTIPNIWQLNPELQFGVGYKAKPNISIVAYYQQLFGNSLGFTNININNGTAVLNQLPMLHAAFIGIQIEF